MSPQPDLWLLPDAIFDGTRLVEIPYWRIDFPDHHREFSHDVARNAEELRERLVTATMRRFERSDVPGS